MVDLSVIVLGAGDDFALIELNADGEPIDGAALAAAAAQGFGYCGSFSVRDGEPHVHCEPGEGNPARMARAGAEFAEILGPRLKRFQQQQAAQLNERGK